MATLAAGARPDEDGAGLVELLLAVVSGKSAVMDAPGDALADVFVGTENSGACAWTRIPHANTEFSNITATVAAGGRYIASVVEPHSPNWISSYSPVPQGPVPSGLQVYPL